MGDLGGIPPTFKTVDFPFVIRYEIENNKIVSHWMLADQMGTVEAGFNYYPCYRILIYECATAAGITPNCSIRLI